MIAYNKETSEEGGRKSMLFVRKASSTFNNENIFLLIITGKAGKR